MASHSHVLVYHGPLQIATFGELRAIYFHYGVIGSFLLGSKGRNTWVFGLNPWCPVPWIREDHPTIIRNTSHSTNKNRQKSHKTHSTLKQTSLAWFAWKRSKWWSIQASWFLITVTSVVMFVHVWDGSSRGHCITQPNNALLRKNYLLILPCPWKIPSNWVLPKHWQTGG